MNDERSRDSAEKIAADRSFLSDDELIRRITAFAAEASEKPKMVIRRARPVVLEDDAAEASGIGVLRARQVHERLRDSQVPTGDEKTIIVSFDALIDAIDILADLAASISSREAE